VLESQKTTISGGFENYIRTRTGIENIQEYHQKEMAPKKTTAAAPAATKTAPAPKAPKAAAPKAAAVAPVDGAKKTLSPVPMPLAAKVAKALGDEIKITQKDVKAICEAFVKVIVADTLEGNTVALPNYITFKRVLRKERKHKNPQTKEEIVKPAHYVLCMDVKASLKKQFEEVKVDPNAPTKATKKTGGAVASTPAPVETATGSA
jgi:DNA-binding protein HU-beta